MRIGEAKRIIGGSLSFPSKMPGTSYGLPAAACITGAKLAAVPGTVCHECYALKNFYELLSAKQAHAARLKALTRPEWTKAMAFLLERTHRHAFIKTDLGAVGPRRHKRYRFSPSGFHRWHDSGDLQSLEHFEKIVEVARRTPQIKHWLPTQELGIVRQFKGELPDNLVVRVSNVKFDQHNARAWPHGSSVSKIPLLKPPPGAAHVCPAPQQNNFCGECRACWDKSVARVVYAAH